MASKKVPVAVWQGRLEGAREVWKRREPVVRWLKDAVAGRFPPMVAGPAWPRSGRVVLDGAGQINVNLCLRAMNHYRALCYKEFPKLRFPNVGEGDEQDAPIIAQLAERVMLAGDAPTESRSAVANVCTTGPWAVWYGIDEEIADAERLMGLSTPIGALIAKAAMGLPVSPLPGMDFLALSSTIRDVLAEADQIVAMAPEIRENMVRLAQESDRMADEEANSARVTSTHARQVWYQHTPYGTRCLIDPTVWDIKHAAWAARCIVLPVDVAREFEMFNPKARREVAPMPFMPTDGHPTVLSLKMGGEDLDKENSAIVVWEIHDKRNRKRHLVSDGYDDYMGVTDEYPFMGDDGEPLLPNFWPMVIRTPIQTDEEKPERIIGVPVLEPGKPHQEEVIKFHSAHAMAAKKTARLLKVPATLDDDTKADIAMARDCSMIPVDDAAGQTGNSFGPIDFGPAPIDYLASELRATANFAKAVGISLATMTGEPVADTLGQEELAMEGASITQKDLVSNLESGYAELAIGTLILVKKFYTDEQIASLIGRDFVEPPRDPSTGQPVGLSKWTKWKATSLYGDKIECVFASRAKEEELAKRKQQMDYVIMLRSDIDMNGLPKWETEEYLQEIARSLGFGKLSKYVPTEEEKAMIQLTIQSGMAAQQQMDRNGKRPEPGGDPTSRIAGGQRGKPPIQNAQSRGRGPQTSGQMQGAAARPNTAV